MTTAWQLPPPALREPGAALGTVVEQTYRALYERHFRDDLSVNGNLPVETRALRRVEEWEVMLLLTPWMFSRLLFPVVQPPVDLPAGWTPRERAQADAVVLGPLVDFTLARTPQKAHLNYQPPLGHYLIQPLVLAMADFRNAEEIYQAWNRVIRTRDENLQRMQKRCPMQQEVSRREFFSGLWQRGT